MGSRIDSKPTVQELGDRVHAAAPHIARASTAAKDVALRAAADALQARTKEVLEANRVDVEAAERAGADPAVVDRLRLDASRVTAMANGIRQVAQLPDPVGEVVDGWVRPNGLRVRRVRVPLGVVGVIYENRPNVTSDAAALCIKSGNAAFLRGSSGALSSNRVIATAMSQGLAEGGLPAEALTLVDDTSREAATEFMQLKGIIDVLIPRGGRSLIAAIEEHATVPYVVDGEGNCHIYIDEAADIDMALDIVRNAKVQRPSVCNAAETVLVHRSVAKEVLDRIESALPEVDLRGDAASREIAPSLGVATEDDFAHEFLSLRLAVAVVDDLDAAIAHIARYGSGHSEAIVTRDLATATRFTREVDAAAVLVNASTRFVDGEELGFGAEIGISTQKLHCRGPMGLPHLTTLKYVIEGEGHIRS